MDMFSRNTMHPFYFFEREAFNFVSTPNIAYHNNLEGYFGHFQRNLVSSPPFRPIQHGKVSSVGPC